ncbi:MAG: AbiJ-NTD4 domain-containing protein [Candidatus Bathyarchaeia archaeon]|jgi:hypothetical protein
MSKFSDRMGITKPKFAIQVESIDSNLKNCLWNIFSGLLTRRPMSADWEDAQSTNMINFLKRLNHSFFKTPTDLIPNTYSKAYIEMRQYFFSKAEWYDIYNLLEFTANYYPDVTQIAQFVAACNFLLEQELSGYRFIGKQIVPMTKKEEIMEVEQAITSPFNSVNSHLENAIKLLSDKTSPDYRNSIKESISSVEAVCKIIGKNEKTDLYGALAIIEKQGIVNIHPALKRAFINLYNYTSDADGIRHAIKEVKINSDFDEAKFMLVACSAFVNYLVSKTAKAGI